MVKIDVAIVAIVQLVTVLESVEGDISNPRLYYVEIVEIICLTE